MDDIPKIPEGEITPPALYFNRRSLLRAGIAAGSVIATAGAVSQVESSRLDRRSTDRSCRSVRRN